LAEKPNCGGTTSAGLYLPCGPDRGVDLVGHPRAKRRYARAYHKEKGSDTIAVLELPPVISPKTVVQAAIVAQGKNGP
jgi:hypothetical protein